MLHDCSGSISEAIKSATNTVSWPKTAVSDLGIDHAKERGKSKTKKRFCLLQLNERGYGKLEMGPSWVVCRNSAFPFAATQFSTVPATDLTISTDSLYEASIAVHLVSLLVHGSSLKEPFSRHCNEQTI